MDAFGVRFAINDPGRFDILRSLYTEIKKDKDDSQFRSVEEWSRIVPDELKGAFEWPSDEQRSHWQAVRNSTVISIPDPADQLGSQWVFDRVFEAIEESEYDVLGCELVEAGIGELHINPHSYPYGGVGPLIALVEAFGFRVLGVNEYGKYQPREELRA